MGITAIEISAKTTAIIGASDVERLIDVRRRQVFLEEELHAVGQRLQQPERADARGSPAVLDAADNLALQPDGVGHGGQQHDQRDHDLDQRDEDESGDDSSYLHAVDFFD